MIKKFIGSGTVVLVILVVVAVLLMLLYNDIGIQKKDIEADARSFQGISSEWNVEIETGDCISAMIFYPDELTEAIYSIYLNRSGLSLGFFFRGGGKIDNVENGITKFYIEGYDEFAYISLNRVGIYRFEIDNGDIITNTELDSQKPFAIVLPSNSGNVYFYNELEEIVGYVDMRL